jgi:hypothetical protein
LTEEEAARRVTGRPFQPMNNYKGKKKERTDSYPNAWCCRADERKEKEREREEGRKTGFFNGGVDTIVKVVQI